MARIPAVAPHDAGFLIKLAYWYANRRFKAVPEPFAVIANHRKLFVAEIIAETAAEKASTVLPANVRGLAVYRVAWTIGCSWCVDFGSMMLRLGGLDIDRLKEIGDYTTSPRYSDDERAAIAYADAMTATPTEVTDEQVADLERRFGRAGVVELTYQIALENMRSRMNSALGITAQGFNSGDACRVPWADAEAARNSLTPVHISGLATMSSAGDATIPHGECNHPRRESRLHGAAAQTGREDAEQTSSGLTPTFGVIPTAANTHSRRHPEVRAANAASLEGRRPRQWPFILLCPKSRVEA